MATFMLWTPESVEDCCKDYQDSTALSAERLPSQNPQDSYFPPQRPHQPLKQGVHTSTLR